MATNQISTIPNLEAICREAAGMKLAHELGDDAEDLLEVSYQLENDDAMEVLLSYAKRIEECPVEVEIDLSNLVAHFLVAYARQQPANVTEEERSATKGRNPDNPTPAA